MGSKNEDFKTKSFLFFPPICILVQRPYLSRKLELPTPLNKGERAGVWFKETNLGVSQTSGEVTPRDLLVVRRTTTMYLCGLSVLGVRNHVLITQVPEASSKIFLNPP